MIMMNIIINYYDDYDYFNLHLIKYLIFIFDVYIKIKLHNYNYSL